jgi:hypothetical protein
VLAEVASRERKFPQLLQMRSSIVLMMLVDVGVVGTVAVSCVVFMSAMFKFFFLFFCARHETENDFCFCVNQCHYNYNLKRVDAAGILKSPCFIQAVSVNRKDLRMSSFLLC